MQSSSTTSIIRHSSSAALATFLRRTAYHHGGCGVGVTIRRSYYLLSSKRSNPPHVPTIPHPSKIFLRALLAPVLSFDDKPQLGESEAIGTVAAAQANYMRVIVARDDDSSKSGIELVCVVKAVLKKMQRTVLAGDKVFVGSIDWIDQRGMITNVFERRSEILDPPVANLDHLLVLFSLDQPKLDPSTLTRFLVEAESTGIPLTLALNKCELVTQAVRKRNLIAGQWSCLQELEYWKTRLRGWNYEPLFCSVATRVGLDAVETNLRNQTSVIVGPSGVGKSSLINLLRNEKGFKPVLDIKWYENSGKKKKNWFEDQSVGEVSTSNGRGKHTTRNVSLLPVCGGGYLADTPGFNKHKLLKVTKQVLPLCFPEVCPEIRKMIEGGKCLFNDCSHIGVEGCAVKDGWERYPDYFQLLDEIRIEEESQLKKYGTKKESDVRYSKVGKMGEKQAVPRLDPKKYKRESRKKTKQTLLAELGD
ncbi:unnamed protein product [Arabis nemorensis]|uniref:EngC GTPase domain-containing protein n=1 Tax=Arabis nemorensis TaxID=586526 RepID=A0A565AY97_9BRAS|nr:unnamed protein product [Arabis nemorensis]